MYLINTNQIQIMQIRERERLTRDTSFKSMGLVILVSFSRKMSKQKLSQKRGLSRSFIIILQKPKLLFSLSLSDTSHTTQTQHKDRLSLSRKLKKNVIYVRNIILFFPQKSVKSFTLK